VICLALNSVAKRRGSGRRAVQVLVDVSLEVLPGEFVLVEGPSGSGKTTLLGVAGGLLTPESGAVTLAGRQLETEPPGGKRSIRARQVGLVFQRANLLPRLTARDNVLLMGQIAGMSRQDAAREVDLLFEQLALSAQADRWPKELSGGEEQRVAVARALVHRPVVVLADEPTGSLDAVSGRAVAGLLGALARERGTAVLVCTHDVRLEAFASRRLSLVDGRVRASVAQS
jgi:putative ABC transport system ATP-binding protein